MLLPTNDGFVGLDGMSIPRRPGVYTYYLNGYDAGTEANDELITGGGDPGVPGIPGDPGANAGTGGTGRRRSSTTIPPSTSTGAWWGILNPTGGPSDLDAGVHRWLNPVAKVTVTVQGRSKRRREERQSKNRYAKGSALRARSNWPGRFVVYDLARIADETQCTDHRGQRRHRPPGPAAPQGHRLRCGHRGQRGGGRAPLPEPALRSGHPRHHAARYGRPERLPSAARRAGTMSRF